MIPSLEFLGRWLIDYYALSTILLAGVLLSGVALRQPARWMSLSWATTTGLMGLALITPFHGFSPLVIPVFSSSEAELPMDSPTETEIEPSDQTPNLPALPFIPAPVSIHDEPDGKADGNADASKFRRLPPIRETPIRRLRPMRPTALSPTVRISQAGRTAEAESSDKPAETTEQPAPEHSAITEPVIPLESPVSQPWSGDRSVRASVALVFLVVASLILVWQILGAFLTLRLQRMSRPADESILSILNTLWPEKRQPPRVRVSAAINQAMATGVLAPVILLPERFARHESPDSVQAVLSHEASHVLHRDLWLRAQQRFLMLILFAHPLFWVLRAITHANQEYLADATARGEKPLDYAEILLHWFRTGAAARNKLLTASVGLWERPHLLKRRIAMVLNENFPVERTCPSPWRITVWSVVTLSVLALSCVTLHVPTQAVAQEAKKKSKGKMAKTKETPAAKSAEAIDQKDEDDQLKFTDDQVVKAKAKFRSAEEAFGVGAAYYNSKNFAASREPFEAALILGKDPEDRMKVYGALRASYRLLGTTEQFVTVSEYIIRHSERDAEQSLTRGSLLSFLHERGKLDPFIKRHEERLKKNPKDRLSLYLLSELYTRVQENPARSIELLKQLAELDGLKVDSVAEINANAKLAAQYIRAKEYQKGAELYEKIAAQDDKLAAWHWKEAALAWVKLKQNDKALAAAKKSAASPPEKRAEALTHFWHRGLGDVFLATGEPKLAIPQFEKALETTKIEGYVKDCTFSLAEAKKKAGE